MEVSLSSILRGLNAFDQNKDGKFSRPEIATAALNMEKDSPEFSLLYTLVAGGKDFKGLYPDNTTKDGLLDGSELKSLAAKDGKNDSFSTNDFSKLFGDRAQPSDINKDSATRILQEVASSSSMPHYTLGGKNMPNGQSINTLSLQTLSYGFMAISEMFKSFSTLFQNILRI